MGEFAEKSTNIELGEGEQLVSSSKYGRAKEGGLFGEKTDCYLHITNKRIISVTKSRKQMNRTDIFVDDVASIQGGIRKQPYAVFIVLAIIGLLLAVIGAMNSSSALIVVGIIVALVMIVLFILICPKAFVLSIYVKGVISTGISVGLSGITPKKSKHVKKIKVKVDADEADEILSNLGKTIVNLK